MKSLEPYNKKLGTDTWFYTKRCFLSLLENLAKHTVVLKDSVIEECIAFLENCELHGKTVKSVVCPKLYDGNETPNGRETVTYEARKLKCFLIKLQNY
ncbi:hypothetical protein HHI36_002956 [Cryptolaemus montrouzieri]|uniref:Tetratricopeptide repeat protein 30 n=1 Tax=Cryptolaemus montrouzieri TaxID=559131 RepID=A0ABD2PDI8_9CUCU